MGGSCIFDFSLSFPSFYGELSQMSKRFKTIFAIQDEPPTWPSDWEDNLGFESISEPDDVDADSNEHADEGDGDGNGDGDVEDREGEEEQFFDTRSGSTSSGGVERPRGKSEDIDTEEDPVGPITPGPGARSFDVEPEGNQNRKVSMSDTGAEVAQSVTKGVDEFEEGGFDDEIEDDWVDPSIPSPTAVSPHRSSSQVAFPSSQKQQTVIVEVPALTKGKGKKSKKGKKEKEVGRANSTLTTPAASQPQQHYPFPVSTDEDYVAPLEENMRNPVGVKGKRMHTTRARDGGRTQSGGVKGVLPADD